LTVSYLSMPPEVRSLGRALLRWKDQIAASHRAHVTNGPTKAANHLIKRVKRIAFGFTRWRNYRIRVLLYAGAPNWDLLPSLTPLNPMSHISVDELADSVEDLVVDDVDRSREVAELAGKCCYGTHRTPLAHAEGPSKTYSAQAGGVRPDDKSRPISPEYSDVPSRRR
jgi:hypothetical protein